ncbi:hypothetical protein DL95DRAFT_399441, partial [Leptodontidium sp. 2 PMI_412]
MPTWSSFGAICPKCALPHSVIRTSLQHFAVTSNLLHWMVWLLSTTIYIGVSRSALVHPLTLHRALWLPLLLAISCPRTFSLPLWNWRISSEEVVITRDKRRFLNCL